MYFLNYLYDSVAIHCTFYDMLNTNYLIVLTFLGNAFDYKNLHQENKAFILHFSVLICQNQNQMRIIIIIKQLFLVVVNCRASNFDLL